MKRCTKCGETKPATTEFFTRDASRKSGFRPNCKDCTKAYDKQRRAVNPEARNERQRAAYAADPEKHREQQRAYKADHAEEINEKRRVTYEKNPEKARAAVRAAQKRHPETMKAANHRRRARILGAEGSHTAEDERIAYRAQKGKCWHCGKLVGDTYEIDHLIPLDKGGSNAANNIVISCRACNRSKGAKIMIEWRGRLF